MIRYNNWGEIPDHIKTKTQLRELRLKPSKEQKPVGTIYSGRAWRDLFDMNEAAPIKEPTLKQKEALEKARIKKDELRTCHVCNSFSKEKLNTYKNNNKPICWICENQLYYRVLFNQLKEEGFFVIRADTTDLLPGSIVHLVIVDDSGNVVLNELLNPEEVVTRGAYDVHGLSNFDLRDKPTFKTIYSRLKAILEGQNVLFFDYFEIHFFNKLYEKYGLEEIQIKSFDAAEIINERVSTSYNTITDNYFKKKNALSKANHILSYLVSNPTEIKLTDYENKLADEISDEHSVDLVKFYFNVDEYESGSFYMSDVLNHIFKKTLLNVDLTTFNDVLVRTYRTRGQDVFKSLSRTCFALDKQKLESKLNRKFTDYPVNHYNSDKLLGFERENDDEFHVALEEVLINQYGNDLELYLYVVDNCFELKMDLFDLLSRHFSTEDCKRIKDSLIDLNRIVDVDVSNEIFKRKFYDKCDSSEFEFKIVYFDGSRVYIDIDSELKLEFLVK